MSLRLQPWAPGHVVLGTKISTTRLYHLDRDTDLHLELLMKGWKDDPVRDRLIDAARISMMAIQKALRAEN